MSDKYSILLSIGTILVWMIMLGSRAWAFRGLKVSRRLISQVHEHLRQSNWDQAIETCGKKRSSTFLRIIKLMIQNRKQPDELRNKRRLGQNHALSESKKLSKPSLTMYELIIMTTLVWVVSLVVDMPFNYILTASCLSAVLGLGMCAIAFRIKLKKIYDQIQVMFEVIEGDLLHENKET